MACGMDRESKGFKCVFFWWVILSQPTSQDTCPCPMSIKYFAYICLSFLQTCPVGPLGGRTAASGGRPLGILPTPTPPTSSGGTQALTTQQMLIETLLGKESWKNPL